MPYLYGNDFSAVQQAAQADEARRQQALQFAFGHLQQANQHAAQRTQFSREMAMRQAMQDWQQQDAQRKFGEGVREFDINSGLNRDQLDLYRKGLEAKADVVPAAIQTETFKTAGDLARLGKLTPEVLATVPEASRAALIETDRTAKQELADIYSTGLDASFSANRRSDLEREKKTRQKSMTEVPLWRRALDWLPFYQDPALGYQRGMIRDIDTESANMPVVNPDMLSAYTQVDPRTGRRMPGVNMPAAAWGMPSFNPTNRFAMSPRMMAPPIDYGTNAPGGFPMMRTNAPAIDYGPPMPTMPVTNAVVRVMMPNGQILRGPASNAPALLQMGGRLIQ